MVLTACIKSQKKNIHALGKLIDKHMAAGIGWKKYPINSHSGNAVGSVGRQTLWGLIANRSLIRISLDSAEPLTSSRQSTCTLPLSRTRFNSISSPRNAAKCNCTSERVSFCKKREKSGKVFLVSYAFNS